jgi:AcrR family transcriptional regulator
VTDTTSTEFDQSARVETVLAAACRVIARDGAHGLHMKAVAREAGVSKALVHYYVQTRQELLRQALAYADAGTRRRIGQEFAGLATGRERLERMLTAYAANDPIYAESHALSSAMWGSLALDEELAPALRGVYKRWCEWTEAVVREGIGDGSLEALGDPGAVAVRLTALAEGLSSLIDTEVIDAEEAVAIVRRAVAELAAGAPR